MLTEKEIQEIIELKEKGWQIQHIAQKIGCCYQTVSKILKKHHVQRCVRCGAPLIGKRLSAKYCDDCQYYTHLETMHRYYKRLWNFRVNHIGSISPSDLSTHSAIYGLGESIGTTNLGAHRCDNFEDEWEAIRREHERIFGH